MFKKFFALLVLLGVFSVTPMSAISFEPDPKNTAVSITFENGSLPLVEGAWSCKLGGSDFVRNNDWQFGCGGIPCKGLGFECVPPENNCGPCDTGAGYCTNPEVTP